MGIKEENLETLVVSSQAILYTCMVEADLYWRVLIPTTVWLKDTRYEMALKCSPEVVKQR